MDTTNDVRADRGRTTLRRTALVAALVLTAAQAEANLVTRDNETLGCSLDCQDSYEVKCTQRATALCVTVTGDSAQGATMFELHGAGIVPKAMLGQARSAVAPSSGSSGFCFSRPGSSGTMKALVLVDALGGASDRRYDLSVQCLDVLDSKSTAVKRLQNE